MSRWKEGRWLDVILIAMLWLLPPTAAFIIYAAHTPTPLSDAAEPMPSSGRLD